MNVKEDISNIIHEVLPIYALKYHGCKCCPFATAVSCCVYVLCQLTQPPVLSIIRAFLVAHIETAVLVKLAISQLSPCGKESTGARYC